MVFGTMELLEAILLQIPLNDLLFTKRVCKIWSQTIINSTKLKTAFGLHSCTGVIKDITFNHQHLPKVSDDGILQLRVILHGKESKPIMNKLPPPWDMYSDADEGPESVLEYVARLDAQAKDDTMTCFFDLENVFPRFHRYRRWTHTHKAKFCHYINANSIDRANKDSSWRSMYATQPALKYIILEPVDILKNQFYHPLVSYHVRCLFSNHVVLINETGVKIGDIHKAMEYVKGKTEFVKGELNSDSWQAMIDKHVAETLKFERTPLVEAHIEERKIALERLAKVPASGMVQKDNIGSGEDGNESEQEKRGVSRASFWKDFYFKLFTPVDLGKAS